MARTRLEMREIRREAARRTELRRARPRTRRSADRCGATEASRPASLHHVPEGCLSTLEPGDVIRLDQAPSLRTQVAAAFCAVLGCPSCGAPGLITYAQYFAAVPVMCGSSLCSCRVRIEDQSRLVYLPVN